jgi:CRP-like cAMP-binding protein
MLSVEQEPIRLPSVLNEVDGPEGRVVHFASRRALHVPRRFQFLWDQVKIGASIYDLSLRLRAQAAHENSRVFLEVASFLCFLVDHDLIDDVRVVRLADSIRGEYEWPDDMLSSLSSEGTIFAWARRVARGQRGRPNIPFTSRSFDFLSSIFVILSLPFTAALGLLLFEPSELSRYSFGPVFLAGFLVGGIVGRTGVAIMRAFAASIGGDAGELKWKIDLLGPHLVYEAHTVTGAFRRATDFVMCFGSVAVPLALILFLKTAMPELPGSLWTVLLSGVLFCAALLTHPSTRSELTKSLRVWNRTPMVWREDDELREVEFFHRLGGFVSMTFAALFFAQIVFAIFKVRPDPNFLRLHFVSVAMVFAGFLMAAVAYAEPFFRHELPGTAKRNKRRRLWATRVKVLSVAAADREAWNELPVLRQLTAPLRRQLMGASRVVQFDRGVPICRQGDTDRSLYIVLRGRLGVARSYEGRRRKVVAILTQGAVFGETAFFFGNPRTADVVAMEDCQLLEIPYLTMMKDLDLSSSADFQFRVWLLQALSGNTMLKDLPSEAMDTLIFAGTRKTFRAGEAVFTEGAPATTCYFIAQGQASAVQQGRKINGMKAGDAFGEIALLRPGSRRTASVVADSDLLCMELEIDAFWALLAARLPLGAEIERLALRRLRADEERRERNQ